MRQCQWPQLDLVNLWASHASFPIWVNRYKQNAGDTLVLITSLLHGTRSPTFEHRFPPTRFHVNYTRTTSTLTISGRSEKMKPCITVHWSPGRAWNGTGRICVSQVIHISALSVGFFSHSSDPPPSVWCRQRPDARPYGCAAAGRIQSSSSRRLCDSPGFHPLAPTDQSRTTQCVLAPVRIGGPHAGMYHLSGNISVSDGGVCYCALATCGPIILGNGTKLDVEGNWSKL